MPVKEIYDAKSCYEVVPLLDKIITRAENEQDPIGYFASLYRLTTLKIVDAIESGDFEDNERMARMDHIFANRYLAACTAYFNQEKTSVCWEKAFQGGKMDQVCVIQHLFLGMNAHINFDLAIAAAATCPGNQIHAFEQDFNQINLILESLFPLVEEDIQKVWPPFEVYIKHGKWLGNFIVATGMKEERKDAWEKAVQLAQLQSSPANLEAAIRHIDEDTAHLAQKITKPGFLLIPIMHIIRNGEIGDTQSKIRGFHNSIQELKLRPRIEESRG